MKHKNKQTKKRKKREMTLEEAGLDIFGSAIKGLLIVSAVYGLGGGFDKE